MLTIGEEGNRQANKAKVAIRQMAAMGVLPWLGQGGLLRFSFGLFYCRSWPGVLIRGKGGIGRGVGHLP